jgi:predicted transcriptional regulator
MKRLAFLLVVTAGACASAKDKADTTGQVTTDTVKAAPAADSLARAVADSASRTSQKTGATAPTKTKAKTASTTRKTVGRDSVIRFEMGAKNRQLGKVFPPDSAKKPR